MKISYDYDELIKEINGDIEDGLLDLNGDILILRDKKSVDAYNPVIDYYYPNVENDIKYDILNSEEEIEELKEITKLYKKDKKNLERVKVSDLLSELEEWNKII